MQNAGASAEIINCTFTENTATNYGGAVEQNNNVTDGALKIVNTTFTNNTAKGGGAFLEVDRIAPPCAADKFSPK